MLQIMVDSPGAYFLGIDAGGTKTQCALAQENTELVRASGGSIKTLHLSPEEATRHLEALLREIAQQSGIPLNKITRTCVGLSGFSVPHVTEWARNALASRIGGEVLVVGDEEIALDAAFGSGPGVLVVAGTGNNIIGRARNGQMVHVGGWGPALADEGSGNWIGKQAVRAIFNALDRGETTLLLDAVMRQWKISSIGALIDHSNQPHAPCFSELTPLVVECAKRQDRAAIAVLDQAGSLLGDYAVLAIQHQQKLDQQDCLCPEVAFTGSVLEHIVPVREAMAVTILRSFPDAWIHTEAIDPVKGALWLAQHPRETSVRYPRR
jgi:N-acetylglucosamine kinase-like BadF-type ATPase